MVRFTERSLFARIRFHSLSSPIDLSEFAIASQTKLNWLNYILSLAVKVCTELYAVCTERAGIDSPIRSAKSLFVIVYFIVFRSFFHTSSAKHRNSLSIEKFDL